MPGSRNVPEPNLQRIDSASTSQARPKAPARPAVRAGWAPHVDLPIEPLGLPNSDPSHSARRRRTPETAPRATVRQFDERFSSSSLQGHDGLPSGGTPVSSPLPASEERSRNRGKRSDQPNMLSRSEAIAPDQAEVPQVRGHQQPLLLPGLPAASAATSIAQSIADLCL